MAVTLIDLSQEIYEGMPVFMDHPKVTIRPAVTHEQRAGITNSPIASPVVHAITLGEHTGTHVDAYNHFRKENYGESIDTMPLSLFYTEAICLDFSYKKPLDLITISEIEEALKRENKEIKKGDTVLFYTDHYRRYYGSPEWPNGPGLTPEDVQWLWNQGITAFAVETISPGVVGKGNKEIHTLCGELRFPHYENVINMHLLIPYRRFIFAAFPLKIRGGTGSPVRAVAIIQG